MDPEVPRRSSSWLSIWPVVVALIINSVGLALFIAQLKIQAGNQAQTAISVPGDAPSTNKDILEKLAAIQTRLDKMDSSLQKTSEPILGTSTAYSGSLSDLLANASASAYPVSGYVIIASSAHPALNVYKENSPSSQVVDQIFYGQRYPFSSKLNNWYLVTVPSSKIGWVEAQYMQEVP